VESFKDCDLIIYNAGVDSHVNDPLGGYLSTEQIQRRDSIVLNPLRQKFIPMVVSLAGGYQKDEQGNIPKVLELHGFVFNAAWFAEKNNSKELV
jgi:acetoin utilization deacetylase AcuC-like enzyme